MPGTVRPGLYDAAHTELTYAELLRRASVALSHGESVVLDATWLDPATRARAAAVARATRSDFLQLRCVAPTDVARSRVLTRALAHADVSDATPEVADRMAEAARPWPDAYEVDTTEASDAALALAAELVM